MELGAGLENGTLETAGENRRLEVDGRGRIETRLLPLHAQFMTTRYTRSDLD